MQTEFQLPLLDNAVNELSRLPGIGRKTALRLALHLLRNDTATTDALADAIHNMRHGIQYCRVCHNISQTSVCPICADTRRDPSTICVVETVRDVISFENTHRYNGLYHVLGGVISPIDGIGPDKLEIESLITRATNTTINEIILALGATMEGDTTNYYIYRRLTEIPNHNNLKITQIARGVSVGNDIEYTDELTLARSLEGRTPFNTPH